MCVQSYNRFVKNHAKKVFFLLFGLAIWHLFCNFVAVFAKITECDGKKLE